MRNSALATIIFTILLSSCASIVSQSGYPISITSQPSGANIRIADSNGKVVYRGITPVAINLKASEGYFKKANYWVKITKDGFEDRLVPIKFKLDGWYFGNILFGGFIGMLIVDPATGAMYKLQTPFIMETLTQTTTSLNESGLRIYQLNEVPTEWKCHLIQIN